MRSLQSFPRRVKFKLSIAEIRFERGFRQLRALSRSCADSYTELRFNSSFKITDSEISFMDLRICWLCRCMVR